MGEKKFRDPIYGYIAVDEHLVEKVIDTAAFQRLRDIIQTSYAPLYSSAVHNRFVHSMGVYHLGRIAVQAILRSICESSSQLISTVQQYGEVFELACLLHDVGHAPFSHTGEMLYLKAGERNELHHMLVELTGDDDLAEEIPNNSYKAAPHEIMSAILSLTLFPDMIPEDKRSFFARCICGYKYVNDLDGQKSCMNCLIQLLNSEIIDVDKLDYLIRDAYMTGFETVKIDYLRLLESIRFVELKKDHYEICYTKSAVSIIENVVYAHDAERKWIQTHPIVLYEMHIIENVMLKITHEMLGKDCMTMDFLLQEGVQIDGMGKVRLLGDSDILYLMKNMPDDSLSQEYYERKLRKHPIWKSESEFQAIFQGSEKQLDLIKDEFDELKVYLRSCGLPFLINDKAVNVCKAEIKDLEQEFENIHIIFPELREPCKFGEVSNVLKSEKSKGEKFFFLYYNRAGKEDGISITNLVERMLGLANRLLVQRDVKQRLK